MKFGIFVMTSVSDYYNINHIIKKGSTERCSLLIIFTELTVRSFRHNIRYRWHVKKMSVRLPYMTK